MDAHPPLTARLGEAAPDLTEHSFLSQGRCGVATTGRGVFVVPYPRVWLSLKLRVFADPSARGRVDEDSQCGGAIAAVHFL